MARRATSLHNPHITPTLRQIHRTALSIPVAEHHQTAPNHCILSPALNQLLQVSTTSDSLLQLHRQTPRNRGVQNQSDHLNHLLDVAAEGEGEGAAEGEDVEVQRRT